MTSRADNERLDLTSLKWEIDSVVYQCRSGDIYTAWVTLDRMSGLWDWQVIVWDNDHSDGYYYKHRKEGNGGCTDGDDGKRKVAEWLTKNL